MNLTAPHNSQVNLLAQRSQGAASPLLTHAAASDADQFADLLRDWRIELTPLCRGPFNGEISLVSLGPAEVFRARWNQRTLNHVAPPADCITFSRPGRGSAPNTLSGRAIEDAEIFVGAPGSSVETASTGVLRPHGLTIKLDFMQAQVGWTGEGPAFHARGTRLHTAGAAWVDAYLTSIEWIMSAAAQYPDELARDGVRGSLLDQLLIRVNALDAVRAPTDDNRQRRMARRLAVQRARDYIRENLAEPIRLSQLCTHARAQARSLEYGFREMFGVSPVGYVRAIRLRRARKLLQSTASPRQSVSEIALDCGFWHLSQFAVDYKRFYGESPSVTHQRTQGQTAPLARRRPSRRTRATSDRRRSSTGNDGNDVTSTPPAS